MRVTESQFEYYIKKTDARCMVTAQHFRHKLYGCKVRRFIRFGSDKYIAASVDGKRFYIMAEPTMARLSRGQKMVLDFIGGHKKKKRRTPTAAEISSALKITMPNTCRCIKDLWNTGYITKKFRVAGSIKLIRQECPVCNKKTEWPYDHECGAA